eukprot:1294963-Prymnesium_polylepis.1
MTRWRSLVQPLGPSAIRCSVTVCKADASTSSDAACASATVSTRTEGAQTAGEPLTVTFHVADVCSGDHAPSNTKILHAVLPRSEKWPACHLPSTYQSA